MKNDDHFSPTSAGLELFPLTEEKEVFNGDGSVFNITFSGPVEKKENGNASLQLNSDKIMSGVKHYSNNRDDKKEEEF